MTPDEASGGLGAILLKLSEFAERLALAEAATGGLIDGVADLRELVEEHQKLLEKTSKALAKLLPPDKPDEPVEPPPYVIQPSVHWWSASPDDRQKAIEHLSGWVEQVYRPHYGHLAVMLAPCWAGHELCLVCLDWLSELHSYLYFSKRTAPILTAQAEYSTRILPATAELMKAETQQMPAPGGRRRQPVLARCAMSDEQETRDYLDLVRAAHQAGREEAEREMADRWNDIARPVTSGSPGQRELRSGAGDQAAVSTSATRDRTTTKAAR